MREIEDYKSFLELDWSREERELRRLNVLKKKSGTKVEVDSMYDHDNLLIGWKNAMKIRMREKQLELEEWMSVYDCDMCAINETGLNGDEYVEVSNLYRWVGTIRDWSTDKSGEAGFIMKKYIRYAQGMCDFEDISFIK